jgi:hypothetical protein
LNDHIRYGLHQRGKLNEQEYRERGERARERESEERECEKPSKPSAKDGFAKPALQTSSPEAK